MQRVSLAIVSALLMIVLSCAALAAPSFRGYTGLVKVPTVNTLDAGEFAFGVMTEGTENIKANDAFGMYGIGGRVEVGVDSFQPIDNKERKTLLNAKYRFSDRRSGVAIGVIDAANEIEQTGYAVMSKSIIRRTNIFASIVSSVQGHLGVGVGGMDGVFGGISIFAGNRVVFSAEYDTEDVNFGFRLTPIRGLRLHAALFDVGDREEFGVGMSYTRTY